MNPLDAMGQSPSVLEHMKALTAPVWDRPTEERQLPKLGRGRPSKEIMRERVRLAKLGYDVPGTEEHAENQDDQERFKEFPPVLAGRYDAILAEVGVGDSERLTEAGDATPHLDIGHGVREGFRR